MEFPDDSGPDVATEGERMTGATETKNYDIQLLAALARKYIW